MSFDKNSVPQRMTSNWCQYTVTAFSGQYDTHIDNGQDYSTISLRAVFDLAATPSSTPKKEALALLASGYNRSDGRCHEAQRQHGQFVMLRIDLDAGAPPLADVNAAVNAFTGPGVARCIYSTSSATPEAPRWRGFIPLAEAVGFADWHRLQQALHLHLSGRGIPFDASMDRAAQYCVAPNVPRSKRDGDGQPLFYQHEVQDGTGLDASASGVVQALAALDAQEEKAQQAAAEACKRAAERRAQSARTPGSAGTDSGLIEAFNAQHPLAECFSRYGFDSDNDKDWHHPRQTSNSHSWRDFGGHWVCISNMARDHGIGLVSASGFGCGDAFDLFVHFDHGGNTKAAMKAASELVKVTDPSTGEVMTWHDKSRADWVARERKKESQVDMSGFMQKHAWGNVADEFPNEAVTDNASLCDADDHRNVPKPDEACLYGLVGDVARTANMANREVNSFAAALSYMVALSAGLGRGCFLSIGDDWHHPRLFALHVGRSGRGRKGTSTKLTEKIVRELAEHHPDVKFQVHTGGLSSREGVVMMIHDGFKSGKDEVEPIHDKRLFVIESEFANVLHQSSREGNTLSSALRDAWDGRCIKPAVKTAPVYASKPHVNMLGHITPSELLDLMKARELSNGFANRFMMIWGEQSALDAFPSYTPKEVLADLTNRTAEVLRFARADRFVDRDHTRMQLSAEARKRYTAIYLGELQSREGGEHIAGLLTRRGGYLLRLAMLFALTDQSTTIEIHHLEVAMHWVRYWSDSVRYVFASGAQEQAAKQTSQAATKLLDYLAEHGDTTRTELVRKCFKGRIAKTVLDSALTELLRETPPAIEVEDQTRKDGPGSGTKIYRKARANSANSAKSANSGVFAGVEAAFEDSRTLRNLRTVVDQVGVTPPDFAEFADFEIPAKQVKPQAQQQTSQTSQTSQRFAADEAAGAEPEQMADDVEEF